MLYPQPERRWPGLVGAYLALVILLAVPAVPIYYYVEPTYKLLVIRVCAGIILAFTFHRLIRDVREHIEQQPSTGFEAAARPSVKGLYLAPQFEKLRNEVENSLRDRSYFENTLRPRLLVLLERKIQARFGIGVAELSKRLPEGMDPKLLNVIADAPRRRTRVPWGTPLRKLRVLVQMLEDL